MREAKLPYRGKRVAARQFTISPYVDDPLRERFAKLAGKRYTFTLSDAVPGGVVAAATQRNRHVGIMSHIQADELTTASDDYLYVILSGNPALYPWVVMQEASPEIIIQDKSDAKYKTSLKVSYSSHGEAKAAAMLPHKIVRVTIS